MAAQATTGGVSPGQHASGNVQPGTHEFSLYDFTYAKWSVAQAEVSAAVQIEVGVVGMPNGTRLPITIFERDQNKPDTAFDCVNATVSGDTVSASWTFPRTKWDKRAPSKRPSRPEYYFTASDPMTGKSVQSGMIEFYKNITISVVDSGNRAVANQAYTIVLGTSQILSGQTDASGKINLQRVPLGAHSIKFIGNPLITPKKPMKIDSPFVVSKYPIDYFGTPTFYKNDYVVHCTHKPTGTSRYVVSPPHFALVPDAPKSGTTVQPDTLVVISPQPRTLTNSNNNPVKAKINQSLNQYSTDVAYTGRYNTMNVFSRDFWTSFQTPTQCEIRGLPQSLPVKAYSPDSFKLSFSFPRPKCLAAGTKWVDKAAKPVVDLAEKIHKSYVASYTYPYENPSSGDAREEQWGALSHPLAIGSSERPVKFEKNGQAVELSVLDAFASVLLLQTKIMGIKELILRAIPKAGIYMDAEVKLLEGKCCLEWCWKEHSDHRVYLSMAASVEMTIIDVMFEIGVGFQILGNVAQLYISIAGSISVKVSAQRTSPDNAAAITVPVVTTIAGTLGFRSEVVFVGTFSATGTTGIEFTAGEFKISTDQGVSFAAGIKWTGVKGAVSLSAGAGRVGGDLRPTGEMTTGIDYTRERVWVDEADWGRFQFPAAVSDPPVTVTDQQVKDIFRRVFSANTPLVVKRVNGSSMPHDDVSLCCFDQFRSRNDVDKRERSLEALAMQIKACLQAANASTSEAELRNFCVSKKYKDMLDAM